MLINMLYSEVNAITGRMGGAAKIRKVIPNKMNVL